MGDFFVEPHFKQIPNPAEDPIGYDRYFLKKELQELGNRVSVTAADLTDEVIKEVHISATSYGDAVMKLDRAKRLATEQSSDLLTALRTVLEKKGENETDK